MKKMKRRNTLVSVEKIECFDTIWSCQKHNVSIRFEKCQTSVFLLIQWWYSCNYLNETFQMYWLWQVFICWHLKVFFLCYGKPYEVLDIYFIAEIPVASNNALSIACICIFPMYQWTSNSIKAECIKIIAKSITIAAVFKNR